MKLVNYFAAARPANNILNALRPAKKAISAAIEAPTPDREPAEIKKWRMALEDWECPDRPNRDEMIKIYREIELDDHVAAKVNAIIATITGAEFEVMAGETASPEKTKLFKQPWFFQIITYFVESEMQGYSLIELPQYNPLHGYNPEQIVLIPRQYVQPDKGFVRLRRGDDKGIPFTEPPYDKLVIGMGHPTAKGLFCNIAPLYIYRKNALAFWSNYQAKFGIPPMVAKTDLADETRKRDLAQFLKGMVNNSFLIADLADEIAPMATGGIDGYETYLNMINLLNDSISRTLEGQTMTSDNGSSRSQAEVHERTAEKWHMARLRRLESIINNKLIPKLIADGAPLATTDTFAFVSRENSNTIVDKVLKLSQAGYQVAPDWVTRQTGIPVTPAPQPAAPAGDLQNHAPYFF